jgi:hypothetical protein
MVLSFLYMAFVRVIQLVRFSCRAKDDLAIEIVMLRHEVAVLRGQVDDQRFGPLIARFSPGCRDFSHGPVAEGSSSSRPPCCAGTATFSADAGPTHTAGPVDPLSLRALPTSWSD